MDDLGAPAALPCSAETTEVWAALVEAQMKMEPPQRTKKAKVKGRTKDGREYEYEYMYAPLDEVLSRARGPLGGAGLGFQQHLSLVGGQYVVRTVIFHKSGQWTAIDYPVFYDASKGHQGFASGVTYARRYGLTLALGIAPEDDDDANMAYSQPAIASGARSPATPGATRAATPKTPPPAPAIANGNGRAAKWIADFLSRPSYAIDPSKLAGWSDWERFYLAICDAATDIDQILKLETDNGAHFPAFREGVRSEVYEHFRARVEENEKRLWR